MKNGKDFADEIRRTLNQMDAWHHGFDNVGHYLGPKRPADRVACFGGATWLLELKELRSPRFPFSRLDAHQERALLKIASAGGFGLVLVKHIYCASRSRCWAILIEDFVRLRDSGERKSLPLPAEFDEHSHECEPGVRYVGRYARNPVRSGYIYDLEALFHHVMASRSRGTP